MKALILCAGFATRLYPLTKNYPKALLRINKMTLLDYIITKIKNRKDLKEIIVLSNHKFFKFFKHWQNKNKLKNLVILDNLVSEYENRRGAIADMDFVIKRKKINQDLLVMGGDNFFDSSLDEFIKFAGEHKPYPVIGVYKCRDRAEIKNYGNVKLSNDFRILDFIEKPSKPISSLVSMCIYYFPKESLKFIREYIDEGCHPDNLGCYIDWLRRKTSVFGFIFEGKWFDIGNYTIYKRIKELFKEEEQHYEEKKEIFANF